jgi:hypothetical protein
MADMKETPEFDVGTLNNSFASVTLLLQQWEEIAEKGIQSENDLNALKISNLAKLGLLRQGQEAAILAAAKKADEVLLQQRKENSIKALEESLNAEYEKRVAALGTMGDLERAAKIAAIKDELEADKEAKLKQIDEILEYEAEARAEQREKELKEDQKRKKKQAQEDNKNKLKAAFGKQQEGTTLSEDWKERKEAFKELFAKKTIKNEDGSETTQGGKAAGLAYLASNLTSALSNFAKQLEGTIDEIASKKSAIDTRLQGSKNTTRHGSYWEQMSRDITGFAGVSPLVKQSAIADRVANMVGQGIAFNVEQRATLDVLKDKIATTFDAANGTLLRLVKIQQQDTTAGRLGMESALTAFLNDMYETTEYMQTVAKTVKGSLEEAMSLMTGENALSFEYQIQKWLGSLSSVGMSDSSVQGLAGVLGQVAAGKIEGITSGGQGNLVIMAANQAGVNMSDILNNGLDQNTTNALMDSMVDYLAKIYNDAGNSKVIQQQIASVYGLSASDLKAAVNLSRDRQALSKNKLDYNSAMSRLYAMAGSMGSRTSTGEMLSNMWANAQYSMAGGIANNPVMYGMYKMSGLLKDTTGGINFGIPLVMGNGMPITFNVADLMRTASLAGGVMSSLGAMMGIGSGGGGGGLTGMSILRGAGITGNGISTVNRGGSGGLATIGGAQVSESGSMVGNSSSDDMTSKTMTDQTDSSKQETASAVDESEDTDLGDVNSNIMTIVDILRDITSGNSILKVAVDGDVKIAQESISAMSQGGI